MSTAAAGLARPSARHAIACARRMEHSLGVMAWHCRCCSCATEQFARPRATQRFTEACSRPGGWMRRQSRRRSAHRLLIPPSRARSDGSLITSAWRICCTAMWWLAVWLVVWRDPSSAIGQRATSGKERRLGGHVCALRKILLGEQ
eukprot:scaffold74945_cov63-Phaeocystis_antarctica.AAC.2